MGISSTECYRNNPAARKKHIKAANEANTKPAKKKKRAECAKKRRAAIKNGKSVKGKDYDHASARFVKSSSNRGRTKSANGSKDSKARAKGSKRKKRA